MNKSDLFHIPYLKGFIADLNNLLFKKNNKKGGGK